MAAIQVMERPILFSGAMVRGILEDRKTQTRRVIKPVPIQRGTSWCWKAFAWVDGIPIGNMESPLTWCPYGKLGDRLWVRETLTKCVRANGPFIDYAADDKCVFRYGLDVPWPKTWKQNPRPSIHMPRAYSRLALEIVSVKVERVQDISGQDAQDEGIWPNECVGCRNSECSWTRKYEKPQKMCPMFAEAYRYNYRTLWDSINSKRGFGWDTNPWVWCLTFKKVSGPERRVMGRVRG